EVAAGVRPAGSCRAGTPRLQRSSPQRKPRKDGACRWATDCVSFPQRDRPFYSPRRIERRRHRDRGLCRAREM
ncbi:MAG: hypothetical protein AVDCRST_MAG42-101, partial [uncultured Chthoniobacterales bacterium]